MNIERLFLNPKELLVNELAAILANKYAKKGLPQYSLDHIAVIVPTAESGRRLRFALAQRCRVLVPPRILTPPLLLGLDEENTENSNIAGRMMELATLADVIQAASPGEYSHLFKKNGTAFDYASVLNIAESILSVETLIAENALSMQDVALRAKELFAESEFGDMEEQRWTELAKLEQRFIDRLHAENLFFRNELLKKNVLSPNLAKLKNCSRIILPGLLSPLECLYGVLERLDIPVTVMIHAYEEESENFDEFGRVKPGAAIAHDVGISTSSIAVYNNSHEEASSIASAYKAIPDNEELPSIMPVDPDMFTELQSAFQLEGIQLYNPAMKQLAASPLGRLLTQIVALSGQMRYDIFSSFMRSGDICEMVCRSLSISTLEYTRLLTDLDRAAQVHLPMVAEDILPIVKGDLHKAVDYVIGLFSGDDISPIEKMRNILRLAFGNKILSSKAPEDREFAAAALLVQNILNEFEVLDLPIDRLRILLAKRLASAVYSLEPDGGNFVIGDGWLELPYLDRQEVFIAGFSDSCISESVVGHSFLPDSLRAKLNLMTNERRAERDAFILKEAVRCRDDGMIHLSFHLLDSKSGALKPSRILFRTTDNGEFLERANRLYVEPSAGKKKARRSLPEAWRLKLPIPDSTYSLDVISPSSLDEYLKCPFTYYLGKCLDKTFDLDFEELNAREFGTLCHDALKSWADRDVKDSTNVNEIRDFLAAKVDEKLAAKFGKDIPAIIALQGESAKLRLGYFAAYQAKWRAEGWSVRYAELPMRVVFDGTTVRGQCDRIDYNSKTGKWCVIDYKTWDNKDKASAVSSEKKYIEYMQSRRLPVFAQIASGNKPKATAWKSLQLPLYCAMLGAKMGDSVKSDDIESCYFILGKDESNSIISERVIKSSVEQSDAEKTVRCLLEQLKRGIFWKYAPGEVWKKDFSDVIFDNPDCSICQEWIDDQKSRLSNCGNA